MKNNSEQLPSIPSLNSLFSLQENISQNQQTIQHEIELINQSLIEINPSCSLQQLESQVSVFFKDRLDESKIVETIDSSNKLIEEKLGGITFISEKKSYFTAFFSSAFSESDKLK